MADGVSSDLENFFKEENNLSELENFFKQTGDDSAPLGPEAEALAQQLSSETTEAGRAEVLSQLDPEATESDFIDNAIADGAAIIDGFTTLIGATFSGLGNMDEVTDFWADVITNRQGKGDELADFGSEVGGAIAQEFKDLFTDPGS